MTALAWIGGLLTYQGALAVDARGAPLRTIFEAAQEAGAVVISYGVFGNAVLSFIIVAFAVFMLVKGVNSLEKKEAPAPAAPTTKDCPHCCTAIPIKATRCPNCTSEV